MIKYICKRKYKLYLSLPVLGVILENFTEFLIQLGYSSVAIRRHLHVTQLIDDR